MLVYLAWSTAKGDPKKSFQMANVNVICTVGNTLYKLIFPGASGTSQKEISTLEGNDTTEKMISASEGTF